MSKEDKENAVRCTSKKGGRKKWNLNPDFPVVLPPSDCDANDLSCTDSDSTTSARASVTFIVCKENDSSTAKEDVKLKNKVPWCDRTAGNYGPLSITNNVNSSTQNNKKDVRRSLQVISKTKVENKKKVVQRRSTDVRKVATKPTSVAGLPQRRLRLKKPTSTSVQQRGTQDIIND